MTPVMRDLILTYITDYTDKRTRPFAFAILLQSLEQFKSDMNDQERSEVLHRINDFSNRFKNAWFWERNQIVLDELRSV